jgi:hypothetical protein
MRYIRWKCLDRKMTRWSFAYVELYYWVHTFFWIPHS